MEANDTMTEEKDKKLTREPLPENEVLKLSNATLIINNLTLKLEAAHQIRNNLVAGILKKHGFAQDSKISLDDHMAVIEGEKIDTKSDDK
jgi:hypothetical protein